MAKFGVSIEFGIVAQLDQFLGVVEPINSAKYVQRLYVYMHVCTHSMHIIY